jgi:riboflavin synthase
MFTGIVEEMGTLRRRDGNWFAFDASVVLDGLGIGDSLSHNGVCLTIVELLDGGYAVEAVDETLRRSNLGDLQVGDGVNLERPVRLMDRLGGHLVQGHVDGVGEVVGPAPDLHVRTTPEIARYLVEKGSITVDGCSLTVVNAMADGFTVAVIPHTMAVTTLGRRRPGDRVNLEVDMLAKYVEKLLAPRSAGPTPASRPASPGAPQPVSPLPVSPLERS